MGVYGARGSLRLWNIKSVTEEASCELRFGVYSTAISPDGKLVAAMGGGGVGAGVTVRNIPALTERAAFAFEGCAPCQPRCLFRTSPGIRTIAFSPDGTTLAVCRNTDGRTPAEVRFCDLAGKQVAPPLEVESGPIQSISYSADGKTLAVTAEDGIRFWCLDKKEGEPYRSSKPETLSGIGALFSADGRTLGTTSFLCGNVGGCLYNAEDKSLLATFSSKQSGRTCVIAISGDGRLVAAGCDEGRVSLFEVPGR